MKNKLFSTKSLLVSLKTLASVVVANILVIPLWAIALFLKMKGLLMLGNIFGLLTFVTSFLFVGWLENRWWKWK